MPIYLTPQGTAAIKAAAAKQIARNNQSREIKRREELIAQQFGPRVVLLEARRFNAGRKVST
jgi:hypothetical protein